VEYLIYLKKHFRISPLIPSFSQLTLGEGGRRPDEGERNRAFPETNLSGNITGGTMLTDTRAASMAEYAVIAAIVIAVAVGVFGTLGGKIRDSVKKLNESEW
jgi:Flp pilus assembly pilin Flp